MVRVMKPNGLGFITTLSPYDVLIKNQVFPNTISPDDLKKIFPEADEIVEDVSSLQRKPLWVVKLDTFISRQLQETPDFVIVEKHPMSYIGKKILAGFNPSYITKLIEDMGGSIILHQQARNIDFPNEYIEGERAFTVLSYIFRKLP